MIRRCFTWFPIGGYRRTQYIPRFGGVLQGRGDRVGRCEFLTLRYFWGLFVLEGGLWIFHSSIHKLSFDVVYLTSVQKD